MMYSPVSDSPAGNADARCYESVVGRFAGSAEVERNAAHEGPQIEISADKFGPVAHWECSSSDPGEATRSPWRA
jgi:hypothetical protein